MKYPTKKDIEKHLKQLEGSLRQHIICNTNPQFVKNALRCLFTDILLEITNDGTEWKGGNFEQMIKGWEDENR